MTLESLQRKKGFLQNGKSKPAVKAGDVVKWLKEDFELGHGNSMAIYALLKVANNPQQVLFPPDEFFLHDILLFQ